MSERKPVVDRGALWNWTGRISPDLQRMQAQHDGLLDALRGEDVEHCYMAGTPLTFPEGIMEGGTFANLTKHSAAFNTPVRCNAEVGWQVEKPLWWFGIELITVPISG